MPYSGKTYSLYRLINNFFIIKISFINFFNNPWVSNNYGQMLSILLK